MSATDGGGQTLVQSLTIRVGNPNEAPTIAFDFPAPPGFVGASSVVLAPQLMLADLNQTIKGGGWVYTADPSVEDDTLTVTIDDLGSSGSGEPITATDSTSFRVQLEPIQRFLDEFFTRISHVQDTDASTPHTRMSVRVASALSGWKSGDEVLILTSRDPRGGDPERITLRTIARRKGKGREFCQRLVKYSGFVN